MLKDIWHLSLVSFHIGFGYLIFLRFGEGGLLIFVLVVTSLWLLKHRFAPSVQIWIKEVEDDFEWPRPIRRVTDAVGQFVGAAFLIALVAGMLAPLGDCSGFGSGGDAFYEPSRR